LGQPLWFCAWLDRLLEEPWLGIDGISRISAGAMNAAVLVDGYPFASVDESGCGTKPTYRVRSVMSAFRGKAENICFELSFSGFDPRRTLKKDDALEGARFISLAGARRPRR
jgi:hypothetical protein